MNCIPSSRLRVLLLCAAFSSACGAQVADPEAPADPLAYRLDFSVQPRPLDASVDVTLRLGQPRSLLRELRLINDPRVSNLRGDGELLRGEDQTRWLPPPDGGTLSWSVAVPHRRNGDGYDAWLGADFGLFRAEDIVPRASSRTFRAVTASDNRIQKRSSPDGCGLNEEEWTSPRPFLASRPRPRRIPQMSVFLGIDIGTSGTKTLAMNADASRTIEAAALFDPSMAIDMISEPDPAIRYRVRIVQIQIASVE